MKICGIDPSSSCTGVALVDSGQLVRTDIWKSPKRSSAPERLYDFEVWMIAWLMVYRPDLCCVEFLSVERNAKTTRVVSHYQAAAVLACKNQGIVTLEARVSSARAAALGNGSLSKEKAFEMIRERFPEHKFGRIDQGGGDRSDALVLALAAPTLAERS